MLVLATYRFYIFTLTILLGDTVDNSSFLEPQFFDGLR